MGIVANNAKKPHQLEQLRQIYTSRDMGDARSVIRRNMRPAGCGPKVISDTKSEVIEYQHGGRDGATFEC